MSDRWARQNVEPSVLVERRNVNKNVSLQTGEEFSMEFLKDHTPIISGKTHNDGHKFGDLYYQNHTVGYDNGARFHELRRIESECPSDAYDFGRDPRTSIRVENGGYMPQCNAYHNVYGEKEVITRKAFGEINSNQGCVTGRSVPQSNNYIGGGDFDRFGKVKFLCSFGGRIMPRSTDEKLKYVGGETHIVSIRKNLSWEELKKKTSAICQQLHSIKYQLPGDELDSLISVSSDEDLQNMIEEYNGLERREGSQRPRLFLIPIGEPENKVQQRTPDCQYAATKNCNVDPNPRKIDGGQTLAGDTCYHVNHLDRNPSFCKRTPGQMLRLDTTAMHPNQLFNGVQYSMSSYPSPPISPLPFKHMDSNGAYSQFHYNNSSSESNNSFSPAQPDTSGIETIDSKYHQQRPLPSVNCQSYKQEAENPYGIQFQSGFNKNFETPNISHVDTICFNPERSANNGRVYCDKVCIPEESKVFFSGSTNSNDSYLGIPHSYSDSTLEINGGHSSYFSQERQSPSLPLNFTKKQIQEKPVQMNRNNDLVDRHTQSNILDLKSTEGGEPMFNFFPNPGGPGLCSEKKTMHIDISAAGNHYDEIYLDQETRNQGGKSDTIFHLGGKVRGTRATPTGMECKKFPIYGNQTSVVNVDPCKQIKQDNERLRDGKSSASQISLEEGIAANVLNQEIAGVPYHMGNEKRVIHKPSDRIQEFGIAAPRARNLEVSGILLNNRAASDEDFLFNIASESANKQIVYETERLELDPTQKNVSFAKILCLNLYLSQYMIILYHIPTVITDLQRTQMEGGLGHVRIPSFDMNQPAPATTSETYNLKIPSIKRQDSPQTSPHTKMNISDNVFLFEVVIYLFTNL